MKVYPDQYSQNLYNALQTDSEYFHQLNTQLSSTAEVTKCFCKHLGALLEDGLNILIHI